MMFKRRRSKYQSQSLPHSLNDGSVCNGVTVTSGYPAESNSDDTSSQASCTLRALRTCLAPDGKSSFSNDDACSRSFENGSKGTHPSDSGNDGAATVGSSKNSKYQNLQPKRVQFMHVILREYERVIGDNPACSNGAPVSIGWAYGTDRIMDIDDFETTRLPRRSRPELILNRYDRQELLMEWGVTFNEIIDSIRANTKAKHYRRRAVNTSYDRWEEAMESASRRIKQTLLLQKPSKIRARDLQYQSELYAKIHGQSSVYEHHHIITTTFADKEDSEASSTDDNGEVGKRINVDQDRYIDSSLKTSGSAIWHNVTSPLSDCCPVFMEHDETVKELECVTADAFPEIQIVNHSQNQDQTLNCTDLSEQQCPPSEQQCPECPHSHLDQPTEGPVLEVMLEQTMLSDPDDDLSTWSMTLDEYEQECNFMYDGRNNSDLSNGSTYEDYRSMGIPYMLQTSMVPVVISEDGQYNDQVYNGFTMQPPPYSNRIISKWE